MVEESLLDEALERQVEEQEALEAIYGSDCISVEKNYTLGKSNVDANDNDNDAELKYTLIEIDLYHEDEMFRFSKINNFEEGDDPQSQKEEVGARNDILNLESLALNETSTTTERDKHEKDKGKDGILFRFLLPPYYPFLPDNVNAAMETTSLEHNPNGVIKKYQPIIEVTGTHILSSEEDKSSLIKECYDIWRQQEGEICLFSCIEILKDYFDNLLNQIKVKKREQDNEEQMKLKSLSTTMKSDFETETTTNKGITNDQNEDIGVDINEQLIEDGRSSSSSCSEERENSYGSTEEQDDFLVNGGKYFKFVHGSPFTEKRSIFQAHATFVYTEDEAWQALYQLKKSDKRIQKATHNIMAYRIVIDRQKPSINNENPIPSSRTTIKKNITRGVWSQNSPNRERSP